MNQNQQGVFDGIKDLSTARIAELINAIFNDEDHDHQLIGELMANGPENNAIVLDDLRTEIRALTPAEFDEVLGNSGLGSILTQKPKGEPV